MSQPLPPYPAYKPAGLPWLAQVPAHWKVTPNRSVFSERKRRGNTDEELLSVTISKGVIRQSDLIRNTSKKDSSNEDKSKYKLVLPGDFAYNKMRMWQGAAGYSEFRGIVSPAYIVLEPIVEIEVRYYHYLMRTPAYIEESYRYSYGICDDQLSLRFEDFRVIKTLLPPLPEQQRIVAFLDGKTRQIAWLLRHKRQLIKLLNEQKQALIHRAVTQGLDVDAPRKDSGLAWLGEVPAHWELRRVKTMVQNVIQQTTSKAEDETYVALENIVGWTGKLNFGSEEVLFESQVKRFAANDVLFGKLRPYLAKVVKPDFKGVCVGELLVLRILPNAALQPDFLEYKLRSKELIDLIVSSTFGAKMPRADWEFIGNIAFSFPPDAAEQQAITNHIRREANLIDQTIARAQREIELIQEYRTSLIADVVTGRVDVQHLAVAAVAGGMELLAELELVEEDETEEEILTETEDGRD